MLAVAGRYMLASLGPVSSAGAQLLLSLILLQLLDVRQFGIFSLLLILSQLSWGVWSALFCAPLAVLVQDDADERPGSPVAALLSTNVVAAVAAAPLFLGLALVLGVSALAAALFAAYAAVALLRWFARAYAYAVGAPARTVAADLTYAAVLTAGGILALLMQRGSLEFAYGLLLASAALAMLPFGLGLLKRQFGRLSTRNLSAYSAIWKRHSGWSLLGVVTTEATANSHAYIVTAALGPAAFAPIAASALMIRPVGVAMNALSEWERPRLAGPVARGESNLIRDTIRHFRLALIAAWLGTGVLVALLLWHAPRLIFPAAYELDFLIQAGILWMFVALVRLLRTPEATLLQAGGQFRPLALATVYSGALSLAAVASLLWAGGILWSIVGVLVGELLCAWWIWRMCGKWLRAREAGDDEALAAA